MAVGHIGSVERKQNDGAQLVPWSPFILSGTQFMGFCCPHLEWVFFFFSVKTSLEMPRGVSHR